MVSPTRTLGFKTSQKLQTWQCLCAQMLFPNRVPLESAPGADVMSAYGVADGCAQRGSKVAPLCGGCKPAGRSPSPREEQRQGELRHSCKPPELTPARTSSCSRTPCLPHSVPRVLPFPTPVCPCVPQGPLRLLGPEPHRGCRRLASEAKGKPALRRPGMQSWESVMNSEGGDCGHQGAARGKSFHAD